MSHFETDVSKYENIISRKKAVIILDRSVVNPPVEFLNALRKGGEANVQRWNAYVAAERVINSDFTPNLIGEDLSGVNLKGVDLSGALVVETSFENANLEGANLSEIKTKLQSYQIKPQTRS